MKQKVTNVYVDAIKKRKKKKHFFSKTKDANIGFAKEALIIMTN